MLLDLAFLGLRGRVRDMFARVRIVVQSRFGMLQVHRRGPLGAWKRGTLSLLRSEDWLKVPYEED